MQDKLLKSLPDLARPEETRMECLSHPDADEAREILFNRGVTEVALKNAVGRVTRQGQHVAESVLHLCGWWWGSLSPY